MHSEFSLLEVCFELLLFSLFAYKLYELGKAYLIPFLYQTLAQEKNKQTEILEKEKLLISTHHRLENQINQQKRTYALLEKKIQSWYLAREAEKEQLKRDEAQRIELIKSKRIIQQTNLALSLALQTIPYAIQATRDELTEKYEGQWGKQELTKLIESISKNSLKNRDGQ
ncbi:hypothetical protein JST56_02575 [Candidatus Dependentiae bacterium]|nr:hypothetical protein [Candidatus Dependentiae bacterium]